jgi:hypothetical protein
VRDADADADALIISMSSRRAVRRSAPATVVTFPARRRACSSPRWYLGAMRSPWLPALTLLASCATAATPGGEDDPTPIDAALVDGATGPDATPGCAGDLIRCDGTCIDPLTDDAYCGASGACTGASAGAACGMGLACEAGACVPQPYSPVGPQRDVDPALLVGWTPCLTESFEGNGTTIASVLAACNGTDLMLACRANGTINLQVLAWAPKASVITDTGSSNNGLVTTANGTAWYFSNSWSWGFAPAGATVAKQSCDTEAGPDRLCWHTSTSLTAGYRCGDNTAVTSGYQRLAYTR